MCRNREVETAHLELECPALRPTVSFSLSNYGFLMQDALCIVRCKCKVLPGVFSWVLRAGSAASRGCQAAAHTGSGHN